MDVLAQQGCSEAREADPSQVHPLETTARGPLPEIYQALKVEAHRQDWNAALDLYAHLDARDSTHKSENLLECRRWAWFVRHEETGHVKVVANSCHLRWCPVCGEAKKFVIKSAVRDWLKKVKRPKFMTLTVRHKNVPLAEQIKNLYASYRLFRQHRFLKKKTRGGIWFFQVKRSENSKQWHPHLHILLDMDYVDKVALRDDWLETTGDSYVVDIRAVKDNERVLNDVARYCSSPCHISAFSGDDQTEVADALHGKRLCGRFGSGRRCDFKPVRPVDFAKWKRLVAWTDCILNRHFESGLQAVIKAWIEGTPIGSQAAQEISNTYAPTPPQTLALHPGKTDPQLYIQEFR